MKRILLLTGFVVLFGSCSKDEILETDTDLNNNLQEVSFIHKGERLTMKVDLSTGEPLYSQTEDFIKIDDILSSENAITYINPDFEFPVIFENDEEFESSGIVGSSLDITKNDFTKTSRQNLDNSDLKIRSSEEMSFTIYEHKSYRGLSFKFTWNSGLTTDINHRVYQNPNLKVCFPFNMNFNDRISSLKQKNSYVAMYEHADFRGKRIIFDNRVLAYWPLDYSGRFSNFHAYKFVNKGRVGYMSPGTDSCTEWFCRDWGDKVSSIYATVGDSPLTPNSSLDYDCYDNNYGNSGGSGGGGGTPLPPREEENHR